MNDLYENFCKWCRENLEAEYEFLDTETKTGYYCKLQIFVLSIIGHGNGHTKTEAQTDAVIDYLLKYQQRQKQNSFVPYMKIAMKTIIDKILLNTKHQIQNVDIMTDDETFIEIQMQKKSMKTIKPLLNRLKKIVNDSVQFVTYVDHQKGFIYAIGNATNIEAVKNIEIQKYDYIQEENELFFSNDHCLLDLCRKCKVIIENNVDNKCLVITGNVVNIQCCFIQIGQLVDKTNKENFSSHEATAATSDNYMPDYSLYESDVNEAIVTVLHQSISLDENDNHRKLLKISTKDSDIIQTKTMNDATTEIGMSLCESPQRTNLNVASHMVVLDGQNIARYSNQNNKRNSAPFMWQKLKIALDYFLSERFQVVAFLPSHWRFHIDQIYEKNSFQKHNEQRIRDKLIQNNKIVFTPSENFNGTHISSYDDRFILQFAGNTDSIVISNDRYRDLMHIQNFSYVIQYRYNLCVVLMCLI
ncbi:unnamed protein product [Didymodactylos carnosus]|uniref:RNase NYN domain-containing protein n=2 Tax=Didymodactylos carnosus TaxID=1234261 RepID=A0A8S2CWQ5_9BILA|nr:unnamed protein product [Didymodactylos carnosus]CAF3566914.1 unnamed protein product [Didymodactylos carnosus]